MARQITQAAQAAKQIRAMLKDNGIEAKVKSSTYSMGSSVDISVTDLAPWTIDAIKAAIEPYEYGTFDGMTDCAGVKNSSFDGPQAKHVFLNNSISEEKSQSIWETIKATFAGFEEGPESHKDAWSFYSPKNHPESGSRIISMLFSDHNNDHGVWNKPRLRAA